MDCIYFYGGLLSNFAFSPFIDDKGRFFMNNEQFFMKMKQETFEPFNLELSEKIMNTFSPSEVKHLGRKIKNYDDKVWEEKRYDFMVKGLRFKFSIPEFKIYLLDTKDKILVEASPTDQIWGIGISIQEAEEGKPWKGRNLLGKALMEIRKELMLSK